MISKVFRSTRGFATKAAHQTEISALKNGARVASQSSAGETATVGVWLSAGSRHDKTAGEAAFLEHLSFQGTKKRTKQQLVSEINSLGGNVHSESTRESTVYYAHVLKSDVPKAVEIISDIVQNSLTSEAAVVGQREGALKRLEGVYNNNKTKIIDQAHEAAYHDHALGRTTQHAIDNVSNLSLGDLKNYAASNHSADRAVIVGAGVEHKALAELAERHFGSLAAGNKGAASTAPIFRGSDKRIRFDNMGSGHIALSFQTEGFSSSDHLTLQVMSKVLGNWNKHSHIGANSASSLAQDFNDNHLMDKFSAFNLAYSDTGLFGLYLHGKDNTLEGGMWYALDNLMRLCHTVSAEEVSRAKAQLSAELLRQHDTTTGAAHHIGNSLITTGQRFDMADTLAHINVLCVQDVKRVANKVINDEDHALAALGAIFELPDYNWIRRRTHWNRF